MRHKLTNLQMHTHVDTLTQTRAQNTDTDTHADTQTQTHKDTQWLKINMLFGRLESSVPEPIRNKYHNVLISCFYLNILSSVRGVGLCPRGRVGRALPPPRKQPPSPPPLCLASRTLETTARELLQTETEKHRVV